MTIDERSRHELHTRLADVLGSEAATTLMSYLPPVGWADVATKHDLEAVEARLESKMDALEPRFDALESRIEARLERALNSQTKTLFFSLAGLMLTLTASLFGALQLA